MNRRQLGATDIHVNGIGYGSMNLTTFRETRPSEDEAIVFIQRMVDELGVDFIDTADVYALDESEIGYGERVIAKALRGERRGRVTVATKGGFIRPGGAWLPDGRPEHLRRACEASLKALETDVIDLYQFHVPDRNVPIEESLGALVDLKSEGKIRHIGVSNFARPMLEQAVGVTEITSVQNPFAFMFYNDQLAELLKFCEEKKISLIAYAPLTGHRNARYLYEYSDWLKEKMPSRTESIYSLALAWLLQLSPSIIPIPATTDFEHLRENVAAADITLTDEEMEQLPRAKSWRLLFHEAKEAGNYPEAIEWVKKMVGVDVMARDSTAWYNMACAYALNGETDAALDALERSVDYGFPDAEHARGDKELESIRNEPRFEAALSRIDVPGSAWKASAG